MSSNLSAQLRFQKHLEKNNLSKKVTNHHYNILS